MNALQLERVFFGYGKQPLLCDLSLSVSSGEWLGIVGPNGSGKTTLLKLVSRILEPWSGAISVFNRNLKQLARRELARLIAYVPQESHFAFEWTVEDIVMMGRNPYLKPLARPSVRDWKVVNEAMELTGVSAYRKRRVNELSAGERQRVIIARALAQEPVILLLDEATSHLDLFHRSQILGLLLRISRKNKTIVSVIHDLNEAFSYCTRVVFFKAGRLMGSATPTSPPSPGLLREVFGVTPVMIRHPGTGSPQFLLPGEDGS